jgi:hypothetical protein
VWNLHGNVAKPKGKWSFEESPEWRYATGSWDHWFERLISNIGAREIS